MNIFALSRYALCGRQLVDKHVVKMPLESAQMLSTVLGGGEGLYKPAYKNHPCTLWVAESTGNFMWLVQHSLSICAEYTSRYKKVHKSQRVILLAKDIVSGENILPITPFAEAMDDVYKVSVNPVVNYRNYYINGKKHLAQWKRNKPSWYDAKDWYDLTKYPL